MSGKILMNNFIMYGLNRKRNLLQSPEEGAIVELNNREDVEEFCTSILMHVDCEAPAVFCVFNDGTYMAVVKVFDDEDEADVVVLDGDNDLHFFADIDSDFRLCCYGLLIEENPGEWKICE